MTIEENARIVSARCIWDENTSHRQCVANGYIQGATDYIDKACEAYKGVLLRHYGNRTYHNMEDKMNILISKFRQELEG